MKKTLDRIFERELNRLDALSEKRPLELDELKALDVLTRSLKQFVAPPKEEENPLEDLSTEELLAIVKGITDGNKAKP
jgi:hypothetical protein